MCVDVVLNSVVTVWLLAIVDFVLLAIAFYWIYQSNKSSIDFEKMIINSKKIKK